jgi:hypothetical protein
MGVWHGISKRCNIRVSWACSMELAGSVTLGLAGV